MLPKLPPNAILDRYRKTLLVRRFEESLILLHKGGHQFGHFHLYIGEEVTGAFALPLLRPEDSVFTTHRNHGHLLIRGADPGRLLAEIMGKATGLNKGKGGTLHACSRELGVHHTSALVGGIVPIATGAAYAKKHLGTDQVSLCLFGDGALEEGAFYESINIAALWKLPVVYLCENNSLEALGQKAGEYFTSTVAARELTDILTPFQIPAQAVDGTDAAAVHDAVSEALGRARQGEGPSFIEARTARWPGSRPVWPELLTGETDLRMAWDPARIPDAHRDWYQHRDGVLRITRELVSASLITPDGALALDQEARGEVGRAIDFALKSPTPDPSWAMEDVFAGTGSR